MFSRKPKVDGVQELTYQIVIKGQLDGQWTEWFCGLVLSLDDHGNTVLTGQIGDQAALHGLLKKIRDLGMPLISVNNLTLEKEEITIRQEKEEK